MDVLMAALCAVVVIAAVLLVNAVIVTLREIKEQQSDWEYLLKTGDDAGYKRREKQ